jgi:hypothetical protein
MPHLVVVEGMAGRHREIATESGHLWCAGGSQASDWEHAPTPIVPCLHAYGSHSAGAGSQARPLCTAPRCPIGAHKNAKRTLKV